ncbi:hypothetical protein D3C74_60870 [compost metagenome]
MVRIMSASRLISLIKRRPGEVWRLDRGSIVLEASLVLPVFMFFVILLVYIVQMTVFSTALQTVASEVSKQVASKIYPVSLAMNNTSTPLENVDEQEVVPKLTMGEMTEQFGHSLPAPIGLWVGDAVRLGIEPFDRMKGKITEAMLDPVAKPLLKPFMDDSVLDFDRIHVTNVHLPALRDRSDPYFRIELSYVLPIRIPFIQRELVLQATAEERLWIGDTGEEAGDESASDVTGTIQLIEVPRPAIRGVYNKIRARIEPGGSANLSIYYKSGASIARHVGWAVADEQGYIEWNWFVGTNTTLGTWSFVIESDSGATLEGPLEVAYKANK